MDLEKSKNIHFIGAGGIGVSALVKYFLNKNNIHVTCSDQSTSERLLELRDRGATIFVGHDSKNISPDTEAVIASSAVPENNPEKEFAISHKIPIYEYPEALGIIMQNYHGIAVSGTNGKTTTTSLLGKILEKSGLDPLVVVGGKVPGWDGNLRLQKKSKTLEKSFFVVEACEYRRNMLSLNPETIVLTNIEADHLDYYKDIDDIMSAFEEFVEKLPPTGKLIYNADDTNSCAVIEKVQHKTALSYGIDHSANLVAKNIQSHNKNGSFTQEFELVWNDENLGTFYLPLPGKFNISNALASSLCALEMGVNKEDLRESLESFHGTWRRFENMGKYRGKIILSDYAHHPTAVRKTIEATRQFYPGKNILVVFQPHQRDRTQNFFQEFVHSFEGADGVILSEIYDVAGREEGLAISSQDLVNAMKEDNPSGVIFYSPTLADTERKIREEIDQYDVVLIMGAGDIYDVAVSLLRNTN
jgi:UDP-N-acetylmuramate--alanine ligase